MEIINKPDLKVFASEAKSGEIAQFPDILRGWGITSEQTQGKPPLEWMNGAFNRVDLNNLYLLQQGIPEWQKEIRYPKNAVVKKGNKVYICLEENENNEPSKYSEKWGDLFGNKRDLDDNVFHGFLQVHADEDIGTGVFLICPDGKVRGQMVYNNYGLQFAQVQEDGTSQTFTFPRYGQGGEIALTSYVDDKIKDIDTSNLVTKDDITNDLGNSTDLVASQELANNVYDSQIAKKGTSLRELKISTNVTYTNNKKYPIFIYAVSSPNYTSNRTVIDIDGVELGWATSANTSISNFFIVPPGAKYKILVDNFRSLHISE